MTHRPSDHEPLDSKERDLGLDVPITRRDFLNSTLLASGALLLDAKAPLLQQTPTTTNAAWEVSRQHVGGRHHRT